MKKKISLKNVKNEFYLLETLKGHWYFIKDKHFPNGVEMPSSTNILEVYPNPQLDFWRENTNPDEIKLKQDEGKQQGTKVHHCCYLLAEGEEINPDTGLMKAQIRKLPLSTDEEKKKDEGLLEYLSFPLTEREFRGIEGFENFWEEFKPVTKGRELQVYHRILRYAGTLDWVGYLWNKKLKKYELWIIDYKISNSHSKAYESQVVSYAKALNSMYGRTFKARLGILYLGKTTKKRFQLKEIIEKKKAWDDFILCKKLWHSLYPCAEPKIKEPNKKIMLDISHKTRGRTINLKQ